MRRLVALATLFLVLVSSSSLSSPAYVPSFGRFAILIHDVSPAYLPQLREITAVIDEYGLQNQTYLFVIPNHGGKMPICEHPEFVEFISGLRAKGYHVELHGYDHIGDEFDCGADMARRKLELGLKALSYLNATPEYFIAPRYSLSGGALEVLLGYNLTVIGEDFIISPDGTSSPVLNREYTWYLPEFLLGYNLESAKSSYIHTKGTFFLSVHPGAVNNKAGMEFLREFFGFVTTHEKQTSGSGLG